MYTSCWDQRHRSSAIPASTLPGRLQCAIRKPQCAIKHSTLLFPIQKQWRKIAQCAIRNSTLAVVSLNRPHFLAAIYTITCSQHQWACINEIHDTIIVSGKKSTANTHDKKPSTQHRNWTKYTHSKLTNYGSQDALFLSLVERMKATNETNPRNHVPRTQRDLLHCVDATLGYASYCWGETSENPHLPGLSPWTNSLKQPRSLVIHQLWELEHIGR